MHIVSNAFNACPAAPPVLPDRRRLIAAGLCTALAGWTRAAGAATYSLDDSASVVQRRMLDMQWRSVSPAGRGSNTVDGRTLVSLSLDTRRWAGRHGRVWMGLAPQPLACVLSWTTGGRLAAGRLEPGQRTAVYDALVPVAPLTDTLVLLVSADGRELQAAQQLHISYELEVA
jgi:hypothetical protein